MLNSYADLMAIATAEKNAAGVDLNAALKEILHYDILFAVANAGVGASLVFQGGTSLRLCHNGNRYSEDLDFVAGSANTMDQMEEFKSLLTSVIADRYGLEVRFKDPKPARFGEGGVTVQRWTAIVNVPQSNPSLPQAQKIKIEVCDVPSRDNTAMLITRNYAGLAPGYDHIWLRTSSLKEILADKILAAANRHTLKPRDVWDLNWLYQKNVPVDLGMVADKLRDYGESDIFDKNLETRIELLRSGAFLRPFVQEMNRFLNARGREVINAHPEYTQGLLTRVGDQLEMALRARKRNQKTLDQEFTL